jgi:hypothetical protein
MKRIAYIWLAGAMLAGLLVAGARAQSDSLGDYARQVRKDKAQKPAAAKQFEDDTLPKDDKLSVVGEAKAESAAAPADDNAPAQAPGASQDGETAAPKDVADTPRAEGKPGESGEDRQKFYEEWKQKIAKQREAVDLATRELDVLQREYRLRAASFYADAGNRLRNAGSWDKEDAQYKQQIADKQKAVDAARQKLDDMQEEARKSGVPASMRE